MTPRTGTDAHPEVEEISALSEGLLPSDRDAEVREHIAVCDLCADILASLREIQGLLGTLPGAHRMPEDVAGRIDAALAAEAHLAAHQPDVPRGTSDGHQSRGDVPRGTSTAPSGRAQAPTGPARAQAPAGPGRKDVTGRRPAGPRRRGRTVLAAAWAVAVLAAGGLVYAVVDPGGGAKQDGSAVSSAGSSAAAAQVGAQVRQLLGGPAGGRAHTPLLSHRTGDSRFVPDKAPAVPPCVLAAIHRAQVPIAAEREAFQGQETYLVVLPHPGDSGKVDAFVIDATCPGTGPGAVLFGATYAR